MHFVLVRDLECYVEAAGLRLRLRRKHDSSGDFCYYIFFFKFWILLFGDVDLGSRFELFLSV